MSPEPPLELVSLQAIQAAAQRVCGVALCTPLVRLPLPNGSTCSLKAENLQPIGSFKLRGAYNKIASLAEAERARGVITYSSGNHAQGVAFAARALGTKAIVVMPSNAPEVKRAATAALGAQIVTVGPASSERRARAETLAAHFGYAVIPPYDDPAIIAGQGTCGLEILENAPDVDMILAPVGGGGLLAGIAAAVKQSRPDVRVIGVEPELAGDAAESLRTGRIASYTAEQTSQTVADGLRTQSIGALNFAHMQRFVDAIVTVTETEIRAAVRAVLFGARLVAEPSGAVAAAALLFHAHELPPFRNAVAVVSGGNIEPDILLQILQDPYVTPQ